MCQLRPGASATTIETLEAARKLFGPSAPEKLLHVVYQRKTEQYLAKLRGDTAAERAKWLARLRDHDGYMAECETDTGEGVRIVEHHSPMLDLLRAFPQVAKFEVDMFQRLLGKPVQREETSASGLYCATFRVG